MTRLRTTYGVLGFVILIVLAILLTEMRFQLLCAAFILLAVVFVFEQLIGRKGNVCESLREREQGELIIRSKRLLIATRWNGSKNQEFGEIGSEKTDYRIGFRLDNGINVIDGLSIGTLAKDGELAERGSIAVDAEFLAIICKSTADYFFSGGHLKDAVVKFLQRLETSDAQRFEILFHHTTPVGLLLIPSDGSGVFEFDVGKSGNKVSRIGFHFRST